MGSFYLLEKVCSIIIPEERHGIRQHPYVTAAAVVVRLGPFAIFIRDGEDLVELPLCVRCVVVCVSVVPWKIDLS